MPLPNGQRERPTQRRQCGPTSSLGEPSVRSLPCGLRGSAQQPRRRWRRDRPGCRRGTTRPRRRAARRGHPAPKVGAQLTDGVHEDVEGGVADLLIARPVAVEFLGSEHQREATGLLDREADVGQPHREQPRLARGRRLGAGGGQALPQRGEPARRRAVSSPALSPKWCAGAARRATARSVTAPAPPSRTSASTAWSSAAGRSWWW